MGCFWRRRERERGKADEVWREEMNNKVADRENETQRGERLNSVTGQKEGKRAERERKDGYSKWAGPIKM